MTSQEGQAALAAAYSLVEAGKPTEALEVILGYLRRACGGDERAVFAIMEGARAAARRAREEEEECGGLVAGLAGLSLGAGEAERTDALLRALLARESILGEGGREQVLIDAHADGSSRVCARCGQLIAVARWDAHVRYWCPGAPGAMGDDDDD